ncbi:homocysteine S-methyltransferase family protein [Clostridium fallax]|uniref:Homocysteine S-methyltransferase n=1 Tax=Clostridium fallax TaxID=1533 RepID=A0A1M4WG97_9CLOT|nr:homocysteine S-methyltransferase family protein [Clostridium fallax]SHE79982.1 homocysteine S-methyltransferase [Clostridium fallax]SQB04944.1 5-methyltetrahydrofolate--homocysteine methyltransferase [Clostridium fallax]
MEDRLYIVDGAMGTELKNKGIDYNNILFANIENKEIVKSIHTSYIKAGAEIISTNTFTILSLLYENKEELFKKVLENVINLIKDIKAENPNIKIALDFGPLSASAKKKDMRNIYLKAFNIIDFKDVDYIYLETQYRLEETLIALEQFNKINKPIILSFTFNEEDLLYSGENIKEIISKVRNFNNIVALGSNCCRGPKSMFSIIEELEKYSPYKIICRPNLGTPKIIKGNLKYDYKKDDFIDDMKKIKGLGATIIGGCCGTNPDYIKLLKSNIIKNR